MFVVEPSVLTTLNKVEILNVRVNFLCEKELLSLTIHIFDEFFRTSPDMNRGECL